LARIPRKVCLSVLTMRNHFIFGAFLLLVTVTAFGASDGSLPDANAVLARMSVQEAHRQMLTAGYRGMRRYVLENERMHKHAEMLVRVQCDAEGTKHFEVVDVEGWKGAYKHVLHKMLDSEAEASSPQIRIKTRLSEENYEFHMVRTALLGDRMTYAIDIIPKRREERLFEGRIWIDAQDYALVRAEGEPAKNPSFWTRSVRFVHTYQKSGPLWFPASTESVTEVRIFGSASLTINYFDYTPIPLQAPELVSAAQQGDITQ
jgi:hypothetical protein